MLTREQVEEQKRFILALAAQAQQSGDLRNAPFEVRQRLIKTIVNRVELNVKEQTFRLEGEINGVYSLGDIVFPSAE